MENYEVRIHYAANNMVSEDARWMKVARGVAGFQSATRFRLSDTIVDTSNLAAQDVVAHPHSDTANEPIDISSASVTGPSSFDSIIVLDRSTAGKRVLRGRKRKPKSSSGEPSPDRHKRTKRSSVIARSERGSKAPLDGYLKSTKARQPATDTPKPSVAHDATVLVPVTRSPKRQHRLLERGHEGNILDLASSQDAYMPGCIDETSFTDHSIVCANTSRPRADPKDDYCADVRGPGLRRFPCNQEGLLTGRQTALPNGKNNLEILSHSFPTNFSENKIDFGTCNTQPAHEHSTTTPAATTATPSENGECNSLSSPLAQKSKNGHISVIDLTNSPDPDKLHSTRRDMLGSVSSPVVEQQERQDHGIAGATARLREFLSAPKRALCQATCTVKGRVFKSFVPHRLLDLAEKFDLANQFRPIAAPDSVQNSQRGYWKLQIRVADAETIAGTRRPVLTSSQLSDQRFMMRQEGLVPASVSSDAGDNALRNAIYPAKDPSICVPWAIDELRSFWACLVKVVERGQAGYDVHASFESRRSAGEKLGVDVKLYGYAESLSHLWLLLYGVSNGLTASMPLQWCVPGAGPLITMSGQPKHGGKLGRWQPKGTGINGSWGLEDHWNGLESEMNVIETTNCA